MTVATAGRACNGCTMCCKLLGIPALEKPRFKWCPHCDIGRGCRIYEDRPGECRAFLCGWLVGVMKQGRIGEHWQPATSKMVLSYDVEFNRIVVHVDSARATAWRARPFFDDIKAWAAMAEQNNGQVIVWQGENVVAVLPDREIWLGPMRPDQLIISIADARGKVRDVRLAERDDPRLEGKALPPIRGA
jgi:hypothetical protein